MDIRIRIWDKAIARAVAACIGSAVVAGGAEEFEHVEVLGGLRDPCAITFAPDGRLFITERIAGRLRLAKHDAETDTWQLAATPFATFDVPPSRHRSSGLRSVAFDPDFAANRFLYAFYMKDDPRHNRLVRLRASADDPDVAEPGETVLLEMPFTASGDSSGSHNGGAVAFGGDGHLYVTTGDGWNGGDDVQSLATYTGKVFRLRADGTIPPDNPFFDDAEGPLRAIYALGLRNPFSMARHPITGELFANDVSGPNKGHVFLVAAGANYGHDGYGGIGQEMSAWANAAPGGSDGRVVSGGAWYPPCGPYAHEYHGSYFAALWGTNGASAGSITRIESRDDPTVCVFAAGVGHPDPGGDLKPTSTAIGPNGHVFYLVTSYEASSGKVFEIRPIGAPDPDLDGDGAVGFGDLLLLMTAWGPCPDDAPCSADLVRDCIVDFTDLLALLAAWG